MTRLFGKLLLVAVVVGFFAAQAALAKDPVRPMRSRSEVISVPAVDGGDCYVGPVCDSEPGLPLCYVTTETGNATHLGRYTSAGCTYIVGPDPNNPNGVSIVSFGADTAANGDQLFFRGTGTLDFGSDPVVGKFTGTSDGGTGRFTNASGKTVCEGIGDAQSCVGTIAY